MHTVYPKKYGHGFVVLCFVVVMQSFIMNSHEVFIHIHQGCFAGTGAIVRLPQCQWSKPDGYGKISQYITTTKHSKAKTVCIFLGIHCMFTLFASAAAYTCPPHSKYSHKMTQCQPTCAEPDADGDCHEPREGCECEKGYVLSGTECVPVKDCGCFVKMPNGDDAYYPVGFCMSYSIDLFHMYIW